MGKTATGQTKHPASLGTDGVGTLSNGTFSFPVQLGLAGLALLLNEHLQRLVIDGNVGLLQ